MPSGGDSQALTFKTISFLLSPWCYQTSLVLLSYSLLSFVKHGFKTFLGITPQVAAWNAAGDEFSLVIDSNPLAEYVELPEGHNNLWYSSILIGVIKGALEMVCKSFSCHTIHISNCKLSKQYMQQIMLLK